MYMPSNGWHVAHLAYAHPSVMRCSCHTTCMPSHTPLLLRNSIHSRTRAVMPSTHPYVAPSQGILEEVKLITWPNPLQVTCRGHHSLTCHLCLLMDLRPGHGCTSLKATVFPGSFPPVPSATCLDTLALQARPVQVCISPAGPCLRLTAVTLHAGAVRHCGGHQHCPGIGCDALFC